MIDQLEAKDHFDTGTENFEYDGSGNMIRKETPVLENENKKLHYYYDNVNRCTKILVSDHSPTTDWVDDFDDISDW